MTSNHRTGVIITDGITTNSLCFSSRLTLKIFTKEIFETYFQMEKNYETRVCTMEKRDSSLVDAASIIKLVSFNNLDMHIYCRIVQL